MADHVSIDDYLAALERQWRGRPDRESLLAEVEDHLRTTAEAEMFRGVTTQVAESSTVERFGDSSAIAEALADANGSPAVPTHFSQSAGTFALAAGGAWLLFGLCWLAAGALDDGGNWDGPPMVAFMAGTAALLCAVVLGIVVMAALVKRHGGLGWPGRVALAAAGLAAPAALLSWFVAGWGTMLSIAWLVLGTSLLRHGIAPRWAVLVVALAWPVGLGTFAVLRANEFGTVDEWGDHPEAMLAGVVVGAVAMTVGMIGYGRWLISEEPVAFAADDRAVA